MLFVFECPTCKARIEADATASGRQAHCPQCANLVAVPESRVDCGTTLGGFRLDHRLGKGGMGEVFLGTQLSVDRQVAVKVLPPGFAADQEAVQRFLHEGRLAARLDHANIVTVHEAGVDNGHYYLAMAYIEGESLDRRLHRDGALPEREALTIVRTVADALAYAWDEFQLLHRDLKPANIMLDRRGRVFLMDLGLAKSLGEESGMTLSGAILGTPHYMSPEQAMGSTHLSVQTDIYALGATLYHLVVGAPPFAGDSALKVLSQHVHEPLPSPRLRHPQVSEACSRLVTTMMAKRPEERYRGWRELIADLDRVMAGAAPLEPAVSSGSAGASAVSAAAPASKAALAHQAQAALARQHQAGAQARAPAAAGKVPAGRAWRSPWALGLAVAAVLLVALVATLVLRGRGGPAAPPAPSGSQTSQASQTATAQPAPAAVSAAAAATPAVSLAPPAAPGEAAIAPTAARQEPPPPAAPTRPLAEAPTAPAPAPVVAEPAPPAAEPAPRSAGVAPPGPALDLMDLAAWNVAKPGLWTLEDGVLAARPHAGNLWTREAFGDFLLECEFRLDAGGNSGVFVRTSDISDLVQTGLEIQVADLPPDQDGTSMACGALWGYLAPAKRAVRPIGEWNALAITCAGSRIEVVLNGERVVQVDTDQWTTPGQAPDGTPTRFRKALRDHPRSGFIGLQGMSTPVWYRRLRLRPLGATATPADAGPGTAKTPLPPVPAPVDARPAAAIASLAKLILSGRAADALQRWREKGQELGQALSDEQRQAVAAQLGALAGTDRQLLASLKAEVGKTIDLELAREKITGEVREVGADGIRVNQVVRQGQGTATLRRTVGLAELSIAERLRRLGPGDSPELNLQRGLLALEAARPDTARRLFDKAGGPLGEALVAELKVRQAEAKETAAEDAVVELLRQISTSPKLDARDKVIAAIRKRCGDDLKRVQAARKALAEFEKDWGDSPAGQEWAPVVRAALDFPFLGAPWTVPGVELEVVWVTPGSFQMGSGTVPTARPVHTVQITKGYWLGKYEVTQAEYKAVTGLDPSGRKGVRNPVGTVSWDDAVAFCAKLTEWERAGGRLPAGYEYRLPSEAEWEYAARGATKSQGFALSGSDRPDEVGWFRDNAEGVHHPVGQKKPNELGLCDMSGNVWEWCLDAYDETYYSRSPGSDPVNTQATTSRATRGGSWDASPDYMRVAERSYLPPGTRGENYGFRACLAPRPGRD